MFIYFYMWSICCLYVCIISQEKEWGVLTPLLSPSLICTLGLETWRLMSRPAQNSGKRNTLHWPQYKWEKWNKKDIQSARRDKGNQLSSHLVDMFTLLEDIFQIKLSSSRGWVLWSQFPPLTKHEGWHVTNAVNMLAFLLNSNQRRTFFN